MFNHHDINRDACMLHGPLKHCGYDWWWHSFTAQDSETGEDKPFFIEFFVCNPALEETEPVLGQLAANRDAGTRPISWSRQEPGEKAIANCIVSLLGKTFRCMEMLRMK